MRDLLGNRSTLTKTSFKRRAIREIRSRGHDLLIYVPLRRFATNMAAALEQAPYPATLGRIYDAARKRQRQA